MVVNFNPIETKDLIKTVSDDQTQLIKDIVNFYCNGSIDLDPTYSKGAFYKDTGIDPKYKFDINPQTDSVEQAYFTNIPLPKNSVKSIMFDPPFITEGTDKSKIASRFTSYDSIQELIASYSSALAEMYRLLDRKGVLIFKCQDTTYYHNNWFTHCIVYTLAMQLGFKAKDLFILTAKNRILKPIKNQEHARKYHSYFWVFVKN